MGVGKGLGTGCHDPLEREDEPQGGVQFLDLGGRKSTCSVAQTRDVDRHDLVSLDPAISAESGVGGRHLDEVWGTAMVIPSSRTQSLRTNRISGANGPWLRAAIRHHRRSGITLEAFGRKLIETLDGIRYKWIP